MAAIVTTRHNPHITEMHECSLVNAKTKMMAIGVAMRKLVNLCYSVLKHQHQANYCINS
jgi:hypothetical protein